MSGLRAFHVTDSDYPWRLRELAQPPPAIWLKGNWAGSPAVAIVGTRKASASALHYARDLATRLVRAGATVWSGGACGIDAAAHEGALSGPGRTVVVMGTGADHCFPKEHAQLFARIVECDGALVYPFEPVQPATTWTFPQRNGVLAALTDAMVVVQAPLQSGARSAARWARRLGRPIFTVPAWPWDELGQGNLEEIRLGAHPLVDEKALAERLAVRLPPRAPSGPPRTRSRACSSAHGRSTPVSDATLPLPLPLPDPPAQVVGSPTDNAVLAATDLTPRHFDEISATTGLPPPLILEALLTLTLQAVLVEGPTGYFRRASG